MSTSLVFVKDSQLFTSSETVASGAQLQHKNVLELIRKYPEDFDTFGRVAFETRPFETAGGPQKKEVALLNEQQAMLLFTYFRNTDVVRRFKIRLVKTFYEMRQAIMDRGLPSSTLTPSEQLQIRKAISARAKKSAIAYQTLYHALYTRFQVAKYDQIRSEDLQTALDFIATCEVALPKLPAPLKDAVVLDKDEVNSILGFIYNWRYLFRKDAERFYDLMVSLQSPLAPHFWEAIHDLGLPLLEEKLRCQGHDVKDLPCYQHWIAAK